MLHLKPFIVSSLTNRVAYLTLSMMRWATRRTAAAAAEIHDVRHQARLREVSYRLLVFDLVMLWCDLSLLLHGLYVASATVIAL